MRHAYNNSIAQKETIIISAEERCTELDKELNSIRIRDFGVYLWIARREFFIGSRNYKEIHAMLIYDNIYVESTFSGIDLFGIESVTECGLIN